jgi:hypothetical protein
MSWFSNLFSKSEPAKKEKVPEKSGPAQKVVAPDKLSTDTIDAIARRAAELIKVPEPKTPELRVDQLPAKVMDAIARKAAEQVKVPTPPAPKAPEITDLPPKVMESIIRKVSDQIKVPEPKPAELRIDQIPPKVMDELARRMVEYLSEKIVQEIAWEVVPQLADLIIKQQVANGNLTQVPSQPQASQPQATAARPTPAPAKPAAPPPPPPPPSQPKPAAPTQSAKPQPAAPPPAAKPAPPPPPPPVQSTAPPPATASDQGPARRSRKVEAELPVQVNNEEEKALHYDARRYARLLVSEIKLYNEQKVKDGRAHGNIYDLLREEIARSREMYDKRVKANVAAQYDYFHHEVITMLAEGDASKLGAGYPGPSINA